MLFYTQLCSCNFFAVAVNRLNWTCGALLISPCRGSRAKLLYSFDEHD